MRLIILLAAAALVLVRLPAISAPKQQASLPVRAAPGVLPMIENVGQWQPGARFQIRAEPGVTFLAQDALWIVIPEPHEPAVAQEIALRRVEPPPRGGIALKLSFVNANPAPMIEPFAPLTTSINYFRGDNPADWRTNVPVWGGVRYRNLYPGIDLELTSAHGAPIRRLVVRDAAPDTLAQVALRIEGAEQLQLTENGILIDTGFAALPFPYFELVGVDARAQAQPQLEQDIIRLPVAAPAPPAAHGGDAPLLPSNLLYATFLGGNDEEYAYSARIDGYGAMYFGGLTESYDFPTTPGAFDPTAGNTLQTRAGFISKLNPAGSALEYSTYIEGNNTVKIAALALDDAGNVYATGYTLARNFPTTPNAPTPGYVAGFETFALKLAPRGDTLRYSMYLGGSGGEDGYDIAVHTDGTVAVTGGTSSADFPTTPNAYDPQNIEGNNEIFVTHISAGGEALIFSTYLGSRGTDVGYGVDFDPQGHIYITGFCGWDDFPTTPGVVSETAALRYYAVAKFSRDGSDLLYSTTIPGDSSDYTGDIFVDAGGNAYVVGVANGGRLPATPGAYDTECGLNGVGCGESPRITDGVLFKLNPTATELLYATYLGGEGTDSASEVAVDEDGSAYVVGALQSPQIANTPGAYHSPTNFIAGLWKLSPDGSTLLHLARIGDASTLALQAKDVIVAGGIATQGDTYETTPDAFDTTYNGGYFDGTLTRLALPAPAISTTLTAAEGQLHTVDEGITYHYLFPAQLFTDTVAFTHAPRHPLSLPPLAPLLAVGQPFVNFVLGTDGTTPLQPTRSYTLHIPYDEQALGIDERTLALYFWDGSAWQREPTATLDTVANHLTATPNRLGWWALTAQPRSLYLPNVQYRVVE